jgi:hydroxyacylglutathione hydrolase
MQFDDCDPFVEFMCEGQPTRPANILEIVAINQGRSPLTMDQPRAPALAPEAFSELIADGHAVIDTRDSAAFGGGHIPDAFNFKMASPEFEQRVGWMVPLDVPMLLVLDSDGMASAALRKLAFIGLDSRVKGSLAGGMGAWIGAGMPQATLPQISVHELRRHLDNGGRMKALDVREDTEWDEGHIEGASWMSVRSLGEHLDKISIEPADQVSVVCAGGVRSSSACSILLRNGYESVYNVTGGMEAWNAARLPTVTD